MHLWKQGLLYPDKPHTPPIPVMIIPQTTQNLRGCIARNLIVLNTLEFQAAWGHPWGDEGRCIVSLDRAKLVLSKDTLLFSSLIVGITASLVPMCLLAFSAPSILGHPSCLLRMVWGGESSWNKPYGLVLKNTNWILSLWSIHTP